MGSTLAARRGRDQTRKQPHGPQQHCRPCKGRFSGRDTEQQALQQACQSIPADALPASLFCIVAQPSFTSIITEYVDHVSGSKESSPALNKLIHDAQSRKFDTVIVWKVRLHKRDLRRICYGDFGLLFACARSIAS